jgi:hypothetical protein
MIAAPVEDQEDDDSDDEERITVTKARCSAPIAQLIRNCW